MARSLASGGSAERPALSTAPFVGRVRELAALKGQVERARAATPAVVVVEGPPGMGKTALVRQALRGAPDLRVLAATADEWETRLPGGVAGQLLAGGSGPDAVRDRRFDFAPDPFALGVELLDLLGRLQEQAPVAVVVDDVQWADTPSVQALGFALRRLQNDQVLAVFAARDGASGCPEVLRRLADGERGAHVRLGGLDPPELRELASAVGRHLSRRAAEHLCAHTGGNPLHARALLEELDAQGLEGDAGLLPAPRSFSVVVTARLAACAPGTVRLVDAAAVMGQRCALTIAASIAGLADPAAALDEAEAAQLLEARPQRQVAFTHPLVRAAVYHQLGQGERSELHARAASFLDGPDALFHRVEAAVVEDPHLAREVESHGREQLAKGALALAAEALLAAARLSTDRPTRGGLVLDAVDALVSAGELARAASLAKELGNGDSSARSSHVLGRLALFGGRQDEAESYLRLAWRLWEDGPQADQVGALVAADLAQVCAMQLRSTEAADWARRAIDASADPELTTAALSVLVPCLGRVGRHAEAVAVAAETAGNRPGSSSVDVEARLGRGIVRLWVDDLEKARADLSAVVDACRDRPTSRPSLVALGMLAETEYRLGRWDDSVVHAALLVSLVEDSEQIWFGAFAHSVATRALAPRGDFERAEHHARAAAQAGRVLGDATSVGCAATAAAHVAFFRGDASAAAEAVQPMLELGAEAAADEPSVHPWRELHVEALLRLGRLEEAEAALETLEALASSRDRRSALAHAARLRAGLEAVRGHHDAARAAFEAALSRSQEVDAPFEQARAQSDYGSFLRRLGERRAAASHLQAAHEQLCALGAAPLARRCQQELAACGSAQQPRADRTATDLTPQELAVARLVAGGQSNREVAAELIVSPKTVEYHLSHVYAKLGVRSRTQLVGRLAAGGT